MNNFKKAAISAVCLLVVSTTMAQKRTGFSTSSDLLLGYKDKVFSTTLCYDLGFKLIPDLYFGVGPMVSGSFGNGPSDFSGGGYGKIRYAIPLSFNVCPFIDGRTGYSYSFSNSSGDMIYGTGLGVRFARKYSIGIFCDIATTKQTVRETYVVGYERVKIAGKYYDRPISESRNVTKKKTHYTPALL